MVAERIWIEGFLHSPSTDCHFRDIYTNLNWSQGSITSVDQSGNTVVRTESASAGSSSTNIAMLNTYYDFYSSKSSIVPYVGLGIGASISNKTTGPIITGSFMGGLNYAITDNFYVGAKGLCWVFGQSTVNDGSNNTLSSHSAFAVDGVLGYSF